MRRILKNGGIALLGMLTLASCGDENPWNFSGEEGGIKLSLTTDGSVTESMLKTRATTGDRGVVVPEESDFKIRMSKIDGTLSKTFSSLEEFMSEESFQVGTYDIEAFYGDIDDEGFGKPYFYDSGQVTVRPGEVSEVALSATLANAMVAVEYSDEFIAAYPTHETSVTTTGSTYVTYSNDDSRFGYVKPGLVNINVTLVNSAGKSVTVSPASFEAEARHQYNLRLNLSNSSNGNNLALTVDFDDSVTAQVVEVDLTDDLFNAPAPQVTPVGFENDGVFNIMEGESLVNGAKFNVINMGGLNQATLTVSSTGTAGTWAPAWGSSLDLIGATESQQSLLSQNGVTARGFFKNPDKMAVLDLSGYISKLPEGSHTFSLVAKDNYTRVSDPCSFTVNVSKLALAAEISEYPLYQGETMAIIVSANSPMVKDKMSFKASDKEGAMKDATILKTEDLSGTRSLDYVYRYTIAIEKNTTTAMNVDVYYDKTTVVQRFNKVSKTIPDFYAEADAYANQVVFKVTPKDSKDLATVTNNVGIVVSGADIPESNIVRDSKMGLITVKGFTASTEYKTVYLAIGGSKAEENQRHGVVFTTEAATPVPNGDFSLISETINMTGVQVGGTYTGTALGSPKYHWSSSIVRSEADGWASINQKTCYTGSSNINTWFLVPSTFADNGAVTVRSVGYNHNGTTPDNYKKTAVYYCANVPTFGDADKAAGELFLGSYSFDGSEHRTDGIGFTSRPLSVTFDYSYTSVNNETGVVIVKVLDGSGNVIAEKTDKLAAQGSMTSKTVELGNYPFGVKAAKLIVNFKSTDSAVPAITVPTGSALKEQDGVKLGNYTLDANTYHAFAMGSELTVDNVTLNYGNTDTRSGKSNSNKVNKRRK